MTLSQAFDYCLIVSWSIGALSAVLASAKEISDRVRGMKHPVYNPRENLAMLSLSCLIGGWLMPIIFWFAYREGQSS